MKKKYLKNGILGMTLAAALILGGCGAASNPSEVINGGAQDFADGKEEEDIELIAADDALEDLMNDFADALGSPEATEVTEDEADEIIAETDDDDVMDVSDTGLDVVDSDEDLKEIIHQMCIETKEVVSFQCGSGYQLDGDTISELYDLLLFEDGYDIICLESFQYTMGSPIVMLSFQYYLDTDTLKQMKSEERALVSKAALEIKNEIDVDNSTEYEIVCAVNDYLCDLVTYPDEDYATYPDSGYAPEMHTSYNALKNGEAVCDGYSMAAKLLLNELGVEAGIEVGFCDGGGHAWNLVKVDGDWYQLDVTWNDSYGDSVKDGREEFLLVTDDFMKQSRTWEEANYPSTPDQAYSN